MNVIFFSDFQHLFLFKIIIIIGIKGENIIVGIRSLSQARLYKYTTEVLLKCRLKKDVFLSSVVNIMNERNCS